MSVGSRRGTGILKHTKYPMSPKLCAKWTLNTGNPKIIAGLIKLNERGFDKYQLRFYLKTIDIQHKVKNRRISPTIKIQYSEAKYIISNLDNSEICHQWLNNKIARKRRSFSYSKDIQKLILEVIKQNINTKYKPS